MKAVVRAVVRIVIGFVMRAIHIVGSLIDPFYMVRKKLRIRILILRDAPPPADGLVREVDLDLAISEAKQIFLEKFKVEIKPFGEAMVQTLPDVAPAEALKVGCERQPGIVTGSWGALGDEFGAPGEYFARNVVGWNAVPISLRFPITVFVVDSITNKIGCSIPIADYVTLSARPMGSSGVESRTTLAHELAHTCLLMHRDDKYNLLYPDDTRSTNVTTWQRWVLRTSRHCTFW